MTKPTKKIETALNELLNCNQQTEGKVSGDMYLGSDIFVVSLREPKVIEGEWEPVDKTVDILDLMDEHKKNRK